MGTFIFLFDYLYGSNIKDIIRFVIVSKISR